MVARGFSIQRHEYVVISMDLLHVALNSIYWNHQLAVTLSHFHTEEGEGGWRRAEPETFKYYNKLKASN